MSRKEEAETRYKYPVEVDQSGPFKKKNSRYAQGGSVTNRDKSEVRDYRPCTNKRNKLLSRGYFILIFC